MKRAILMLIISIFVISLFADGTNTSAGAPIVNALPFTDTGDLIDNTDDNSIRYRDEWWEITPTINLTNVDIHPLYDGWDGYLFIYDASLNEIAFDDDGPGGTADSQIIMDIAAGQTIYVVVDEYSSSTSSRTFTLNISADQTGVIVDQDAPEMISNVNPPSGATDVALLPTLTWDFGADTETYDLYFDTVNPPVTQVVTGAASGATGSYTPAANLVEFTTYYWMVVCHNTTTTTATINNMNFTTLDMSAGHITNASPANSSLNVPLDAVITWDFAANAETYDLYFDTVNPPVAQIITDGTVSGPGSYTPTGLQTATYYYWKVVSKNSTSLRETEDMMNFQTTLGTDVLTIGNGTEINHYLPIEPYFGYSYSQTIYLQSEINTPGRRIEKIYYQYNMEATLNNCNDWVIYMSHTPNSSFASTDDWLPISQFTEVYNGPLPAIPADGWIEFVLTTPFVYNNTDNLVIAVEENQTGYAGSAEEFFGTSVTENRSIYYYSDSNNPDPLAPPTAGGTPAVIPNTRLFFGDVPAGAQMMYNPQSYDYGTLYTNTASSPVSFMMQNTGLGTLNIQSVTIDDAVNYTLTDNNTYPLALTTAQSANFTVTFNPINDGTLPATVTLTDDLRQNYTISLTGVGFNNTISAFPYTQSFENGGALPIGWEQGTDDDLDWSIGTSTPSTSTGPQAGDHTTGTGYFVYTEASSNLNSRFDLLAPPVDITALTNPFCSFWYNMYGQSMGSLHVDIWDGSQWNEDVITAISGDQGQDWHAIDVPLTGYNNVIQIRFRGITGSDYYSDICLDDISFWDNGTVPGATTLNAPADLATGIPMTGTVTWNSVMGASGYFVNMGTDNPPTDTYSMIDAGNILSFDYTGLTSGSVYYWQIVPYNAIGNAVNCPVWSFTTFNAVPNTATLVSPANASLNQSLAPILEWADGGNYPDGYRVYLGTDNPPTDVIDGVDAGFVTSYAVQGPLEYSTNYYWQIIPYNFVGDAVNCPVWSFTTRPEGMVIVGDGTETNHHLPIEPYYGYSYSQSIYYPSDFGTAGFITSISYEYNGAATLASSTQWVIYMGTTSNDSYATNTDWVPLDQLTMVYNGTIDAPTGAGWIDFTLDNMFFYDGMSNLVIAVEENEPQYGTSSEEFFGTAVDAPRSIYYYSDTTNPDPATPETAMGMPSVIPNTRFFMIPPSEGPYVVISALAIDFGVESINGTSDAYNVRIANFGNEDAVIDPASVISGENADQFSLVDNNTYPIIIPQFDEVNFNVYFHPTSGGHKEAVLTIVDNVTDDARETHSIPLHGYAYVADNNDVTTTATEVSLEVINQPAIIEPATDIDWYAFWQTGPAQIDIHTENLYGSTIDLAAFLYGPYNDLGVVVDEGTAIATDDDSWTDGVNPHITADVTESGFYYLRIASFDNAPAITRSVKKEGRNLRWETSDYALWIESNNLTPPDGFDPPTALDVSITYQGINLTWQLPVPATRTLGGYNVYRDDVIINPAPVTTLFYLDSVENLVESQSYEYKVTALYTGPTGESVACDSIIVQFESVDPPVIADDFESYNDFVTSFGDWIINDEDGENTYGFNNGIDFPGENSAMAYIIFNPTATTPPLQFASAYSGDKYAACFAADTGVNDDWMITPQIQLTNNNAYMQLMARSYTTQFGSEKFEIAVSNGTTNLDDFTVISGDQPVEVPATWTPYVYPLNDYAGQVIRVAIRCVSQQTFFMMLDDVMVVNDGATVGNPNQPIIPEITTLRNNYPNPFNPETSISFDLKENANVSIDIYNIKGQRVASIADGAYNAGRHSVVWKGTDLKGNNVSSGVYFYKMTAGTFTKTKKMILMK